MIVPHLLRFDILHRYASEREGVSIPVQITVADRLVNLLARVDTASSCCVFQRAHGERLGLDIEAGFAQTILTATGSFRAYGHEVTLDVVGLRFDSLVYFAESDAFPRNVLGRQGWLDRVRLALVHHDSHLYLSPYAR